MLYHPGMRTDLSPEDLAVLDADLAARGLRRTTEPRWQAYQGARTRATAEQIALDTAAYFDPSRPSLRWVAWNVKDERGTWQVTHYSFEVEALPAPEPMPTPRLASAVFEANPLLGRLVAAILWNEHYASKGSTAQAQQELEYARSLAHQIDEVTS
jgi:hypothetical protein